jgi:hypothetical protein
MKDAEVPESGRADADAEDDPARGDPVQRGGDLGELPGAAARDRRDHRPDPDPRGPGRHHGENQPRVHDRRAVAGVREHQVIPEEEAVKPGPLGTDAKLDQLIRLVGEARYRDAAQQPRHHHSLRPPAVLASVRMPG